MNTETEAKIIVGVAIDYALPACVDFPKYQRTATRASCSFVPVSTPQLFSAHSKMVQREKKNWG